MGMAKYRIIKTNKGKFRIQERYLLFFWFTWRELIHPGEGDWLGGTELGEPVEYDCKQDAEIAIEAHIEEQEEKKDEYTVVEYL